MKGLLAALVFVAVLPAQVVVCDSAPVYEPCEITVEFSAADIAAHPNPYATVQLRAEFRSPKGGSTKVMRAFWDGARTFRIRFAPDFEGRWDLRLISNIPAIDKKIFSFQAAPARTPGFIEVFNSRYFRYSAPESPHYWMGFTSLGFSTMPWETFTNLVDSRAQQKFNHLRGLVLGASDSAKTVFAEPDQPSVDHFRELDRRIEYLNSKGIVVDLLFAGADNELADLLPQSEQRERYIRYVVARYGAYNITWQGLEKFESYKEGRSLLHEAMGLVQRLDPYQHPRSTHTQATSSPIIGDGWMTYITHQGASDSLAVIDYETHLLPVVNAGVGVEGAINSDELRKRMWRVAIRGSYPTYASANELSAQETAGVQAATHLFDFFGQTRYFDLQPYYRLSGGHALSLQYIDGWDEAKGVEYVVYMEEPGPVDLLVPKSDYDVSWFNPVDGSWLDEKKKFKGDRYRGSPPDTNHDWVLYVRREGKKESFNKRYYLEARRVVPKDVEARPAELPFEIQFPDQPNLVAGETYDFNATVTKSTEAAKQMAWLWIGEVSGSGRSAQVIATDQFGRFQIPSGLTDRYPATFSLRLLGVDGAGRLYEGFRAFTLEKPGEPSR
ncbi:MAG: DUF5060 domain-containing protein [Acidobacteria bacterium]|nr:DUF5060 domain-containing protein [Acidobacteriota bacterium]MDA1233710.1 DUF5060 domain-containing protein [Acidobacteriota bacterium]